MADKAFTIDKVEWHTGTPGNTETLEHIHARFRTVISFLQQHGLVVRTILSAEDGITDEFAFKSSDLTPDGLSLMKACYDKWLRRIDRGMPPDDVTILEKGLQKIRQAS